MTHPIFYTFRRCPYAMRARMAVYKAGITHEHREVVLREKPAHMLEISPKGTVPVIQLANGSVLEESTDIIFWALEQNDPDGWLNTDMDQAKALITQNDGPFKKALDRYKYPNRFPDEDTSGARDQGEDVLKELDKLIKANQGYLVGNATSIADIAIFPFIRQFANTDRGWFDALPYKDLQNWLAGHLDSDLFKNIMTKYDQWQPEDEPVIMEF